MVLGPHLPGAVLREGMPRAGDHPPAGGREPLDGGMPDAAARSGEEHDRGGRVDGIGADGHARILVLTVARNLSRSRRSVDGRAGMHSSTHALPRAGPADPAAAEAALRVQPLPAQPSPSRVKTTRSCRRNGRSCQNSIDTGAMRKPVQYGGRGTSPMRVLRGVDGHRLLEREAALERARLLARPGADPAVAGTALEIGVRLRVAHERDGAAGADLPAQALPVQHEGGLAASPRSSRPLFDSVLV